MRHHSRAEHGRGEQHCLGALQAGHEPTENLSGGRRFDDEACEESHDDDREHAKDDPFENVLLARILQKQHQERHHADDHAAEDEWQSEQKVQCDGPAEHLREVGCHCDGLGLCPERESRTTTHPRPDQGGQSLAGDDAELRRLVLNQHGDDVGQHQHPDQQKPVSGPCGDVGCDVARVDVGDRGDEGGAE